jgi:hypothetical protein
MLKKITGYDSMGHFMSKPNLRSALEEDLKAFVNFMFIHKQLSIKNSYFSYFSEFAKDEKAKMV